MKWLRRLFGLAPVVYIHPAYLRPARLRQVGEVLFDWAMDSIGWQLAQAVRRPSLLLDPRFGLVGDGPGALIQRRTKL